MLDRPFSPDLGDRVARAPGNPLKPAKTIGEAMDWAVRRATETKTRQYLKLGARKKYWLSMVVEP